MNNFSYFGTSSFARFNLINYFVEYSFAVNHYMTFFPSNNLPVPTPKPVVTSSYVVQQKEVLEDSIERHPLAPTIRAGVGRTQPSSPQNKSSLDDSRPEGQYGPTVSSSLQVDNEASFLRNTRGIKKRVKILRRRPLCSKRILIRAPRRILRPMRTNGVISRPVSTLPYKPDLLVSNTGNDKALVLYQPTLNSTTVSKVGPVFNKLGPVLKDVVFSMACDQVQDLLFSALPMPMPMLSPQQEVRADHLVSSSVARTSKKGNMASLTTAMESARLQVARTAVNKLTPNYEITQKAAKPRKSGLLRVIPTVGQVFGAVVPPVSGGYVVYSDIALSIARQKHEAPYRQRQAAVKVLVTKAGATIDGFSRDYRNIVKVGKAIDQAYGASSAMNVGHELPQLDFFTNDPVLGTNRPGVQPAPYSELERCLQEKTQKLLVHKSLLEDLAKAKSENNEQQVTQLEGALMKCNLELSELGTKVATEQARRQAGLTSPATGGKSAIIKPKSLAQMNRHTIRMKAILNSKMGMSEPNIENGVLPIKYMVGLDEKLVQDFRQICIDFDGKILAHPKSHKQQLLLLPEITNHPELVPYVMSAEELADFQKLVDDLGNSLNAFDVHVDEVNQVAATFEDIDQQVKQEMAAVAGHHTINANDMQTYSDFFVRERKPSEFDWRQYPGYQALTGRLEGFIMADNGKHLAIISVDRQKPLIILEDFNCLQACSLSLVKGAGVGAVMDLTKKTTVPLVKAAFQGIYPPNHPKVQDEPAGKQISNWTGALVLGSGLAGGIGTGIYGVAKALHHYRIIKAVHEWKGLMENAERFFNTVEGKKLQSEIFRNLAHSLFEFPNANPPNPPGGNPPPPAG